MSLTPCARVQAESAQAALLDLAPEELGTGTGDRSHLRAAFASQGVRLLEGAEASGRLARHGRPLPELSLDARSDELERAARELLELVAFGRDDEVAARGGPLLERVEGELAVLNGSDGAARALADVCLIVTRAHWHRGAHDDARRQAGRCAVLVPGVVPSADIHPPEVIALLSEARALGGGALRVRTSEAPMPDCEVRVQGRPLGRLDMRLTLLEGSYAVHVACDGEAGLVHRVQVVAGRELELEVATSLERRLRWDERSIVYRGARNGARTERDLAQLARWLDVGELFVVHARGGEAVLSRLSAREQRLVFAGEVTLPIHAVERGEGGLGATVRALLSEGALRAPLPPGQESPRRRRARLVLGALAGAGVVSAWGLWGRHKRLDAELGRTSVWDAHYGDLYERRDRLGRAAVGASVGGSLLALAALVSVPPRGQQLIGWSVVSGLVGGALVAGGATAWARQGERDASCTGAAECTRTRETWPLAALLTSQGTALLMLPLTLIARRLFGNRRALSVAPSTAGRVARYGGIFGF